MREQEYIKLEGTVDSITYTSEETGFTVLWLETEEDIICVVGQLLGVAEGEDLSVIGYFQTHVTFGQQFKAQMFERRMPATATAMRKYLGSGALKGIGSSTAGKIVAHFGDDTFKILEQSPERLSEVKGITSKKATEIGEQFKHIFGVRALMVFLSNFNITPNQSVVIFKRFGNVALDLIKANPYILCEEGIFINFAIVDEIAEEYNIPRDNEKRIVAGISYVLTHNLSNGHTSLPRKALLKASSSLLALPIDVVENCLKQCLEYETFFSLDQNEQTSLIYLSSFYQAQKYIASRLKLMLTIANEDVIDVETTINYIEQEKGIEYETLQREAIKQASEYGVFILTGGPGTGKTTTLNGVLEVLESQGKDVVLAAPTGRASKRLSEVTGHESKTIHRLLEVQNGYTAGNLLGFTYNENNYLNADVVIIDEMSMVDTMLFDSLLRGMKPKAKLVMVGDFNQLPSVGAGNVLRDLIESNVIPQVQLTCIFRQAAKSLIVTNAHKIVAGQLPELNNRTSDFFFMAQSNNEMVSNLICDLCSFRLPNKYKLSPFEDIQVLCPQRKGEIGMTALNHELQNVLNPSTPARAEFKSKTYTFRLGDKVMQTKNNYDIEWTRLDETGKGIFNGDIGKISMIDKGSKTLSIEFDQRQAFYTFDMANEQLDLAYAITVHKSQGCEFEAVIIPVLGGYDKLYYRNLLYTAVTRAKQILIIVGTKARVADMVLNERIMFRYTGLKIMLQELVDGNDI